MLEVRKQASFMSQRGFHGKGCDGSSRSPENFGYIANYGLRPAIGKHCSHERRNLDILRPIESAQAYEGIDSEILGPVVRSIAVFEISL